MESLSPSLSSSLVPSSKNVFSKNTATKSNVNLVCPKKCNNLIGNRRLTTRIEAINDASTTMNPAQVEVTWQIVVGAIGKYYLMIHDMYFIFKQCLFKLFYTIIIPFFFLINF